MTTLDSTSPATETPPRDLSTPPTAIDDDDFGDVELGERQPEACQLGEACTACQ